MESEEAEAILNRLLSDEQEPPAEKAWNYLVGRLEGNGVGPNSSFFTLGKSVEVGEADDRGTVRIKLHCDVTGPWMDGEPMTHSVHFLIPRSSLPEGAKEIQFVPTVTRDGDSRLDKTIVPPEYPPFGFSLAAAKPEKKKGGADAKSARSAGDNKVGESADINPGEELVSKSRILRLYHQIRDAESQAQVEKVLGESITGVLMQTDGSFSCNYLDLAERNLEPHESPMMFGAIRVNYDKEKKPVKILLNTQRIKFSDREAYDLRYNAEEGESDESESD